jgi:hypothetical protein
MQSRACSADSPDRNEKTSVFMISSTVFVIVSVITTNVPWQWDRCLSDTVARDLPIAAELETKHRLRREPRVCGPPPRWRKVAASVSPVTVTPEALARTAQDLRHLRCRGRRARSRATGPEPRVPAPVCTRKMFSGFTSQWTIPRACTQRTAPRIGSSIRAASAASNPPAADRGP